jgi:hypothetical protein
MKLCALSLALIVLSTTAFGADEPATFEAGAFKFNRPAEWSWVPVPPAMQAMRKAQLTVPGKEGGKPAEIIFYYFGPGQGGGVKPNVDRWLAQFQEKAGPEKVEEKKLGTTNVTTVAVEGTYSSGMPTGPKTPMSGYALLGAILEHPEGAVFVKMTGPAATVRTATPRFHELVASAAGAK